MTADVIQFNVPQPSSGGLGPEFRMDDWKNEMSQLGSIRDKAMGVSFGRRSRLKRDELDRLYAQNPIAARVVDRVASDAFREGWEFHDVEGDPAVTKDMAAVQQRLQQDLQLDVRLAEAIRWSRLYGGAISVFGLADGRPASEPLNWEGLRGITAPVNVAADDAIPTKYDGAFGSRTYRQILEYQVTGLVGSQPQINVHHSRLLRFEPIAIPLEARLRQGSENGWGPSVLDRLYDDLRREGSSRAHAVSMLYIASILYIQLDKYRETAVTKDGRDKIRKFLREVKENLDVLGLLGLDGADKIGSVQHAIPNIHDLIDRMRNALASATDMPREILFNESPAGLNAGELTGPQQIWYAHVGGFQEDALTPVIDRACRLAFRAWKLPIKNWSIRWLPLFTPTEEKIAAVAKTNAETDSMMLDRGVITPDHVFQHRVVEGKQGPIEVQPQEEDKPLDLTAGATPEDVAAQEQAQQPAETKVQDEALNGAQIASLLQIVEKTQAGLLPRDAAIEIIRASFPSQSMRAEQILGSAGLEPEPGSPGAEPPPVDVPEPDDAMSIQDAARRLGMNNATPISAAIRRGDLRYWGLGKRKIVSLRELAEVLRRHEEPAEPEPSSEPAPEGDPGAA